MVKKEVRELPEKIVSRSLVSKYLDDFKRKKQNLMDAYNRLPQHLSTDAIPHNPREITAERLTAYVEKMKATIPEDNKQGRLVWDDLRSDSLINIKAIQEFFEAFPDAEFVVTNNISQPRENRIACTNKSDVINKAAEVEVPDDCKAYFDKIQGLADAIHEMREYEKVHGIRKRSIEEMTYYADHAEEYAGLYVDGYFQKK